MHQVGSHISLEASEPTHRRIAIPDHRLRRNAIACCEDNVSSLSTAEEVENFYVVADENTALFAVLENTGVVEVAVQGA